MLDARGFVGSWRIEGIQQDRGQPRHGPQRLGRWREAGHKAAPQQALQQRGIVGHHVHRHVPRCALTTHQGRRLVVAHDDHQQGMGRPVAQVVRHPRVLVPHALQVGQQGLLQRGTDGLCIRHLGGLVGVGRGQGWANRAPAARADERARGCWWWGTPPGAAGVAPCGRVPAPATAPWRPGPGCASSRSQGPGSRCRHRRPGGRSRKRRLRARAA